MPKVKEQKKRGPKRQLIGPVERATIYCTAETLKYIRAIGNGNLSEGVRHLADIHRGGKK
jgi:hypothetical protein